MVWQRSRKAIMALTAVLMPISMVGCETGELGQDGPPDLPGPVAQAIEAPGPFPVQRLPHADQVEGFAIEPFGEFIVMSSFETDPMDSHISLHLWNDEEERWADAEPLEFSGPGLADGSPALAPDGSYLLFGSARPSGNPAAGDINIWVAQREDGPNGEVGWTDPWLLPAVHSPAWDGSPSLAGDGSLYFSSMRDGPEQGRSLYMAPFDDGMWMAPQRLPDPINSSADDADPYVAPDQSFVIFASNREGRWDLYMTRSNGEEWGEPQRLPDEINSDGDDRAPYMTAAGSTLFWVRDGQLMASPAHAAGLDTADGESEVAVGGGR